MLGVLQGKKKKSRKKRGSFSFQLLAKMKATKKKNAQGGKKESLLPKANYTGEKAV